jgi:tRNA nucleotidyltransferase (CCA-adding enzyme)
MAHQITKDTKWAIDTISKLYERFDKTVVESQALTVKDLAINGYDIINDGFLKGKEIGDCLRWMLDIVLEHPEYNTREKLLELLQTFKEMSFQAS